MKYENIRIQVLDAILEAAEQGLIRGTSGNIALRDEKDPVVAITPSGIPYKNMTPDQIAIVDLEGNWLDGPYKPSSEVPMHTAVLKARPDINATVHTHAMFATIMAMGEGGLQAITPPHCEFVPIPVVPFALPGSREAAEKVAEALGTEGRGVLIKNHGMFCCGKNMEAAMEATSYVEEMALTAYYAKVLGVYEPLGDADVEAMKEFLRQNKAV